MKDEVKVKFDLQFFAEEEDQVEDTDQVEDIDPLQEFDEEVAKETINDLQAALDESNRKVEELEGQLSEAKTKFEDLMQRFISFAQSIGIVKDVNVGETSEKSEDIIALEAVVEDLQGQIRALTEENDSLTVQIAELKANSINNLVETIVARKLELGDITEEDVDAEKEKLLSRSESSLRDTLDDLSQRKVVTTVPRVIEKVINPSLANNEQQGVIKIDEGKKDEKVTDVSEITPVDVFKGLLTRRNSLAQK